MAAADAPIELAMNAYLQTVIDLNPRIAGGYPFSHVAGANLPAALIAWLNGEHANPKCFQIQPNLTVSRTDEYLLIRLPDEEPQPRAVKIENT
jgi:hypothetical protein